MREIMLKGLWPAMMAGGLLMALSMLSLLGRRAKRGSKVYRARMAVLALLVGLAYGGTGCSGSQDQGVDTGDDHTSNPDDDPQVLCYEPMMDPPPQDPQDPPPDDVDVPIPPPEDTPMCYAPMVIPDDEQTK